MFPVSDFNFVYCGMATFAATVGGYVYAKRRRIEPVISSEPVHNLEEVPTEPQSSAATTDGNHIPDIEIHMETFDGSENNDETDVSSGTSTEGSVETSDTATIPAASPSEPVVDPSPSTITRGPSLKRKRMDDHDQDDNNNALEYPYNLAALYPNKRCKTPPPPPEITVEMVEPKESITEIIVSVPEPIEEPTSVLSEETKPVQADSEIVRDSRVIQPDDTATKVMVLPESKKESRNTAVSSVVLPEPSAAQAPSASTLKPSHKSGFESFATAPASLSPGNATLASGANMRPVWSTSNNFRKRHSFVDNPDEQSDSGGESSTHALGLGPRQDVTPKVNRVTGEEEEDVESELKGVKLFIKRGSQDFSTGILGQVKYLWNKKTSSQRVLFRRDLGKISMNTRLQPTVRCTFDSQECILRLLLAETALGPQEIVVYALKPGRFCSRKDFQSFAESVMGSASLK